MHFVRYILFVILIVLFVPVANLPAAEIAPHDAAALAGIKEGRAIFDVRTNSPKALLFILKVIEQTEKEMSAQGVEPDFILSFRGGTLPLLTQNPKTKNDSESAILEEVRERLKAMRSRGMVLEACHVAAGIFKVKREDLADDLIMIGNSLISLIGYQSKGYVLVPMY